MDPVSSSSIDVRGKISKPLDHASIQEQLRQRASKALNKKVTAEAERKGITKLDEAKITLHETVERSNALTARKIDSPTYAKSDCDNASVEAVASEIDSNEQVKELKRSSDEEESALLSAQVEKRTLPASFEEMSDSDLIKLMKQRNILYITKESQIEAISALEGLGMESYIADLEEEVREIENEISLMDDRLNAQQKRDASRYNRLYKAHVKKASLEADAALKAYYDSL